MIDKNITKLVKIINKFPDVYTSSSCGGHINPDKWHLPHNEWSVTIYLLGDNEESPNPSIKGWGSIGKIAQAIGEYISSGCGGEIILQLWNNSGGREDDIEGVCNAFDLHGCDTDRDVFCDILMRHLPNGVK